MTEAERDAITTPEEGLIIFNSGSQRLNIYQNSAWVEISTNQKIAMRANATGLQSGNGLLNLDTEIYDYGSYYDPSTKRYTPQVAGLYLAVIHSFSSGVTDGAHMVHRLYKN